MFSFSLKRLVILGAIAVLPTACAPGASAVMPAAESSRATQSGPGGGGAAAGGGNAATCQPLPGTCVLVAKLQSNGRIGLSGQVRFERSPTRMALTGSFQPGALTFPGGEYYAIALDSPAGSPVVGYAARGTFAFPLTSQTVTLETISGDGLLSQTPNAMPISPGYIQLIANAGQQTNALLVDPTPPAPAVLALFAAVHSGSSVHIALLAAPAGTAVGSMYVPVASVLDTGPIGTLQ